MAASPRYSETVRFAALGVALAVVYVLTARLGFRFAVVAEQVTMVWAPTGLAQAALLLWGRRLWPAVWIGAFAANVTTEIPLWTAAATASGNTLEAYAAALLLPRLSGFDPGLRRVRDAILFVLVAAIAAPAVSATVGASALCGAGVQPWSLYRPIWADWWLGDALGAIVVGPVLLTLARAPGRRGPKQWAETALLIAGTVAVIQVVFSQSLDSELGRHPLEYTIFPFVIVAAVRGGQPATALVILFASAVTIWNTVRGAGPFGGTGLHESLFLLQAFMGVLAATGLVLAAAMTERRMGERRRAAAAAVADVLASSATLRESAPRILQHICEQLEWPVGAFWLVGPDGGRLVPVAVWRDARVPAAFAEVTERSSFGPGEGLPGRVWAGSRPAWIQNVVRDRNFPRADAARRAGLAGAFAFPITLDLEVLGVIECFNRAEAVPDVDLLRTMSTVGNQIGQFMGRKRVEEAVLAGQRRTQAMVDVALDAVIGMNEHGIVTEFNPAAERMFGYARDEAVGRDLADLLIPPALREQHRAGLARYLATGVGPFMDRRVETTGHRADGSEFPVEVAITRLSSGDGPPRFTGFVRDLTARVEAEREREQLLQRELIARRQAEAANRAKDEFLATLSHELRTPLNAIAGWTRMLLDGTIDRDGTRRALEIIERNAQLQAQLVADILDVSRIITGGLRLERGPVDLPAVIAAGLDAVRPAAEARRIRITSDLDAAIRIVEGDAQRLQQVVWNLLSNAVKFTPPGGWIRITLADGPDAVRLSVQDSGAGIDPGFLPHVFERFTQADGTFRRSHGGLGLGLAIVRHLVELHGGTVRAESEGQDQGATFVVELPRGATRPRTSPASQGEALGQQAVPE